MSVSLLLCEGIEKSPDVRVLRSILSGIPITVRSSGGKYGLGAQIRTQREARNSGSIAGILDRDFDLNVANPIDRPITWENRDARIVFGWRWERCEIENYLIDPSIVRHAAPDKFPGEAEYLHALQAARQAISVYTAARVALSVSRKRFNPLQNCWGNESNLHHMFPEDVTDQGCLTGIETVLQEYQDCVGVTNADVITQFDTQKPQFAPGGIRHQNFLHFYSGKDLLVSMQDSLGHWGFDSPKVFREAVIKGIEQSVEDVWNWLPEWANLRQEIINWQS